MKRKTAFTLIELLVVIAIIAILASLLSPSLKNARDKARAISCLYRLKQMHTACFEYAGDHNGILPDNMYGGTYTYWWYYLDPYLGVPPSQWSNWDWIRVNQCIYRCPSDTTTKDMFPSHDPPGTPMPSIAYNAAPASGNYCLSGRDIASVRYPAQMCMFMDGKDGRFNGWWSSDHNTLYCLMADAGSGGLATLDSWARHQHGFNIVYVDGHAEWRSSQWIWDNAVSTFGGGPNDMFVDVGQTH